MKQNIGVWLNMFGLGCYVPTSPLIWNAFFDSTNYITRLKYWLKGSFTGVNQFGPDHPSLTQLTLYYDGLRMHVVFDTLRGTYWLQLMLEHCWHFPRPLTFKWIWNAKERHEIHMLTFNYEEKWSTCYSLSCVCSDHQLVVQCSDLRIAQQCQWPHRAQQWPIRGGGSRLCQYVWRDGGAMAAGSAWPHYEPLQVRPLAPGYTLLVALLNCSWLSSLNPMQKLCNIKTLFTIGLHQTTYLSWE